jgi:hypothetical protein
MRLRPHWFGTLAAFQLAVNATEAPRSCIELRTYTFATPERRAAFARWAADALVPALHRLGLQPIGLFQPAPGADPSGSTNDLRLFILIPHPDANSAMTLDDRLAADSAYLVAETAALAAPIKDPVYIRRETQLLQAFRTVPTVRVRARGPDRVLQLRIYESHNEDRARRKVEMFEEGGELAIFERVGMAVVMFGRAFAGRDMPNLTYILSFENRAELDRAWAAFRADSEWLKLKDDARYADTVSRITNLICVPLPGSDL